MDDATLNNLQSAISSLSDSASDPARLELKNAILSSRRQVITRINSLCHTELNSTDSPDAVLRDHSVPEADQSAYRLLTHYARQLSALYLSCLTLPDYDSIDECNQSIQDELIATIPDFNTYVHDPERYLAWDTKLRAELKRARFERDRLVHRSVSLGPKEERFLGLWEHYLHELEDIMRLAAMYRSATARYTDPRKQ